MAKRNNNQNETANEKELAPAPRKEAARTNGSQTPKDAKGAGAKKSADKKTAAKTQDKGPSFFQKAKQFFREVRIELKKVTWPSRKQTIASTSVVLVVVIVVATYLGLVDVILSRALKLILH